MPEDWQALDITTKEKINALCLQRVASDLRTGNEIRFLRDRRDKFQSYKSKTPAHEKAIVTMNAYLALADSAGAVNDAKIMAEPLADTDRAIVNLQGAGFEWFPEKQHALIARRYECFFGIDLHSTARGLEQPEAASKMVFPATDGSTEDFVFFCFVFLFKWYRHMLCRVQVLRECV